jgi:hypothetical protein
MHERIRGMQGPLLPKFPLNPRKGSCLGRNVYKYLHISNLVFGIEKPEFENHQAPPRFSHILGLTGGVLLIFGATAFKEVDALRLRSFLHWNKQTAFEPLNIYLET